MSATQHSRMTSDEFIAWAIEQPTELHYELECGEVINVARENLRHALVRAHICRRLGEAIAEAGVNSEAFPSGLAVVVNDRTVYEPDALVRSGPALRGDDDRITDPLIVVEVSSPATCVRDEDAKFAGYFSMASVRHYLIVDPADRCVVHHERGSDGAIRDWTYHSGSIRLDPPGILLKDFWPEGLIE